MSSDDDRIGCRATIVSMDHSPITTHPYRWALVGRQGVVVAHLRNKKVALLKLDECYDLPGRWAVAWDDLVVGEPARAPGSATQVYVAGFSGSGRAMEQHAVVAGTAMALCSSRVKPLPFSGWSLTFSPTAPRACSACVKLVSDLQA